MSVAASLRNESLIASFERAGYLRLAPTILQPAGPFLDLSGEDIRKRMFLTTDAEGHELCLRPDLTIPVSRDYLASPGAGRPAGFCYLGPLLRDPKQHGLGTDGHPGGVARKPPDVQQDEPHEFRHAGI